MRWLALSSYRPSWSRTAPKSEWAYPRWKPGFTSSWYKTKTFLGLLPCTPSPITPQSLQAHDRNPTWCPADSLGIPSRGPIKNQSTNCYRPNSAVAKKPSIRQSLKPVCIWQVIFTSNAIKCLSEKLGCDYMTNQMQMWTILGLRSFAWLYSGRPSWLSGCSGWGDSVHLGRPK